MHEQEGDIRLDIIEQQEPYEDDEAARLRAAQLKTFQLLQAWRSRFTGDQVTATYGLGPEQHIAVQSASRTQVRVEQTQESHTITYDYDDGRPVAKLQVSSDAPATPTETARPDDTAQLEALAQLLFDCDRNEVRQQEA